MAEEISFEVLPPGPTQPPALTGQVASLTPEQMKTLEWIDAVAQFLDAAIKIPGLRWRFGADGVVGLIFPGVGDAVGILASGFIVFQAHRLGLPPHKLTKMVTNILVDAGIGVVPLVGDAFDLAVKANIKNAQMVRSHFNLPPLLRK